METGRRLVVIRHARLMRQNALSLKAGISATTICSIEAGQPKEDSAASDASPEAEGLRLAAVE
jgi:DNA-binding XRE family transcriptional regulator